MLMPAGSAWLAMVDSWIGARSGSSVHVPCVASLLLQGVEEGGGRFRVVAVVRSDHVQQRRLHVLAHRDRTADVEVGAALQPVVQVAARSEERRVGKEGVGTCRSRGSPYP